MRELFAVFKTHPWISGLIIFLALFIPILPIAVQYGAIYALEKQTSQKVSIGNVDINLFNGKIAVYNIKLQNETETTKIKAFEADLRLSKLLEKRLQFAEIKLIGTQLPVEIIQDGDQQSYRIAGIPLPQSNSDDQQDTAAAVDFGVDRLTVSNFQLNLIQQEKKQLYQIRSLTLDELYSWDKDFARLKLNSALNQHKINANLQLHLFSEIPKLVGTLKVQELNLADIQNWLPFTASGQLDGELTFTLEQRQNGLTLYQYSEINMQQAELQIEEQNIAGENLHWKGDVHYFHGDIQGVKIDGKIEGNALSFKQESVDGSLQVDSNFTADIHLAGQLNHDTKIRQSGQVTLTDLTIKQTAKAEQQTTATDINYPKLAYNGDIEWFMDSMKLRLDGHLKGEKLKLGQDHEFADKSAQKLTVSLPLFDFKGQQEVHIADNLKLSTTGSLNLDNLAIQQSEFNVSREKVNELKVRNQLQATLNLNAELDDAGQTLQQNGSIKLRQLNLEQNNNRVQTPQINWNGKIALSATDSQQKLEIKGKLKAQSLAVNSEQAQINNSVNADLNLKLNNSQEALQLQQQGSIQISDLSLKQTGLIQQAAEAIYQGNVDYQLSKSNAAEQAALQHLMLNGKFKLTDSQTQIPQSETSDAMEIAHNLDSDFTLNLEMNAQNTLVDYQGKGTIQALKLNQGKQISTIERLNWQGNTLLDQTVSEANPAVQLSGKLKLNAERIRLGDSRLMPRKPAISIQNLDLKQLTLTSLEQFSLRNLDIRNIQLQGYQNAQKVPLNRIGRLTLDQAKIQTTPSIEAKLGNIVIKDTLTQLTLDKEKQIVQISALKKALGIEAAQSVESTQPATEKTSQQSSTQLAFNSLQLTGDNAIKVELQSEQKPIHKDIHLEVFEISAFDSQKPQDLSNFRLIAAIDEFSRIESSGKISPSTSQISLDAQTKIDGLSLNDFSPLIEEAIGYKIDSGQLSATIDSLIKQNKLDINNKIKLYKFKLSSADQAKTDEFNKNFNVPLEIGLDLLQDKSGNIKLDLPINGDLENPNFSISSIVSKALNGALGKATRTYLLLALQPFGAIALVGELALDQVSAVRLQPVTFLETKASLSAEMQQYLQKVATLLKSRTNVQIKLCGGASESDRAALIEMTRASQAERQKQQDGEIIIRDERLLALAKLRQSVIKRYLIKQGVSTNQLVLCQPKIDAEKAAPKVDLGI
ncbi:DUF748 domain-containing protein [Thiomicrorhabdus sp. 6S3-12]|uniref:DUF748 domain-containing protein n=1 Tax=Thiomicrorhabdus sp. 6S3-12 TaxID=2819681 RepID=UPI001AACE39F|nr:DUF748 domain-containing protein [Thiomicrorhabdus sp. 6S3-12]MBO1924663.1 DUF748 domain-containing protein [Thiomicrorhabdus sp. 6S3-12]